MWSKSEVKIILKYCQKCGTKLRQNAKFCEKCGTDISDVEIVTKKSLNEIEKELKEKIEKEYQEKQEKEYIQQMEKKLRREKERELKKSQKAIYKINIVIATIVAIGISIAFILLMVISGNFTFGELIKDKILSDGNSYITNSGFPFRFITISNTPTTKHISTTSFNYFNLIMDFALYAVCLFIFVYTVLWIMTKRNIY
jgi:hypothetical protein